MNEEEKKAVEIIKGLAVYYDDYSLLDEEEIEENESVNKSIELILNLIEKLSKENEQLRTEVNSLKKENEELNEKILDNAGIYQLGFKDGEESYIKKVKDKIEEYKNEIGQLRIEKNVTYDSGIYKLELKREALQELLESEE